MSTRGSGAGRGGGRWRGWRLRQLRALGEFQAVLAVDLSGNCSQHCPGQVKIDVEVDELPGDQEVLQVERKE